MITKIINVPKDEAYPFCKRFFFELLGGYFECFGDCLEMSGWVGFPHFQSEDPRPILILFANMRDALEYQYAQQYENSNYKMKIIVTDIKNDLEADEIIDLTNFETYYQTELSLKEFINKIFE